MLYLDCGSHYMGLYICQDLSLNSENAFMYAYFNSMKLDLRGKKGSIGCYGEMKLPGRDSVGTGRNDDACIRTSQWRWGCKVIRHL